MKRLVSRLIRTLPIVLALALLLAFADAAFACPTCKENMAADPAAANLVRGYFWSILFMLSMPFLILGGLSSYFYYEVRRARSLKAAEEAAGLLASKGEDYEGRQLAGA